MQHARAMHVVQFKALHLGAIDECGVWRGEV
jgi:hypothetical protein